MHQRSVEEGFTNGKGPGEMKADVRHKDREDKNGGVNGTRCGFLRRLRPELAVTADNC